MRRATEGTSAVQPKKEPVGGGEEDKRMRFSPPSLKFLVGPNFYLPVFLTGEKTTVISGDFHCSFIVFVILNHFPIILFPSL